MREWKGYQNGVNLGGWLSQCSYTKEHYDQFIVKKDLQVIASWGLDHVRLPFDYNLVQTTDGQMIEEGFMYLDECIQWCKEFGLNLILDLHKTQGYSFDEAQKETGFFHNPDMIQKFLNLWATLAKRYGFCENMLAFELLNEVVAQEDNEPWMKIAQRAIDEIRIYAPTIKILVGSYMNNSVLTVKEIAPFADPDVVYNFHCYDPLIFTHQGAYWLKGMPLDFRMHYPMKEEEFVTASNRLAISKEFQENIEQNQASELFFEQLFAEALKTAKEHDRMLYCGEYGVIDRADPDSTLAWYQDIQSVFRKYGIGHARWSYKKMDFGLTDSRLDGVRDRILIG